MMRLEQSDIAIIQEVLSGYQDFIRETVERAGFAFIPMSPRFWHPYKVLQTKITVYLPLVQAALRGELPQGFTVLSMHDNQCLAWDRDTATMYEPTTLFQSLLWCHQQAYLKTSIARAEVFETEEELQGERTR